MMVINKHLICLLFFVLFFSCGNNLKEIITNPEKRLELAQKKFENLAKENKFHGGVLIAKGGEIIFENAYGTATDGTKNEINQSIEIASMGKMFTGVA